MSSDQKTKSRDMSHNSATHGAGPIAIEQLKQMRDLAAG